MLTSAALYYIASLLEKNAKNPTFSILLLLVVHQKKNADAAGPLGDLGHTARVLIPQYLR